MYGVTFHSEPSVVDKTELGLKLAKADLANPLPHQDLEFRAIAKPVHSASVSFSRNGSNSHGGAQAAN
jgi:predicted outer membrane repeat protein